MMRLLNVILFSLCLPINIIQAATPVWTFAPLTATTIQIPANGTALIQYQVTNQSKKSHTLVMTPITGITQITTTGNCPSRFVLDYKQSCILTLQVSGILLKGPVVRGPVVCQQNNTLECYQPGLANSLNISITPTPVPPPTSPALIAGGSMSDSGIQYPLLAESLDNGTVWNYTITNTTVPPGLPTGFTNSGAFTATSCNDKGCIAVGNYNAGPVGTPMVAQRISNNMDWNYTIQDNTPTHPASFLGGNFYGAGCNTSICIATGSYADGFANQPLLAQNTNFDMSWDYQIYDTAPSVTPLPNFLSGQFTSASCAPGICIAPGDYSVIGGVNYPLLAQSTNNGNTWIYSINAGLNPPATATPILPPDYLDNGHFLSGSCSGAICITVGYYSNGVQVPLLAQSTPLGTAWSYQIDGGTPGRPSLPADFASNGILNTASCSAGICIAAGGYIDTSGDQVPLLAQSTDNGATWSYHIDSGNNAPPISPTLPPDSAIPAVAQFVGGSCSSGICIAVGSYLATNGTTYPLLAQSTDDGATWIYRIDSSYPTVQPTDYTAYGTFNGASCNANACIAMGSYLDSSFNPRSLLAQSTDSGATWQYSIDASTPTPIFGGFNAGTVNPASFLPAALKFIYQYVKSPGK